MYIIVILMWYYKRNCRIEYYQKLKSKQLPGRGESVKFGSTSTFASKFNIVSRIGQMQMQRMCVEPFSAFVFPSPLTLC